MWQIQQFHNLTSFLAPKKKFICEFCFWIAVVMCLNLHQIPQWCAEFCLSAQYQNGMVVCTQIHHQTTVELALRVADEMDVNIGNEVGYSIPLQACCSPDTVLRCVNDNTKYSQHHLVICLGHFLPLSSAVLPSPLHYHHTCIAFSGAPVLNNI